MNNFKRILALILALLLCLSVVGCRKSSSAEDDGTSSAIDTFEDDGDVLKPAEETDSSVSSEDATSSGEELTSSDTTSVQSKTTTGGKSYADTNYVVNKGTPQEKMFGDLKGTKVRVPGNIKLTDWEKAFNTQFEKKYGCTVEIVPMSFAEEQTKLPTIIASGDKKNYLDLCTISNVVFLRYVYGNIVQNFAKYMDVSDATWKYYGANSRTSDQYTIDGKIYGATLSEIREPFVYYNKTYFRERGIKDLYSEYYKKNNWTFDTFRQVAKQATKLAADNKTVETYGFATWNYFAFAQAAGNSVIKNTGKNKWAVCIQEESGMAALNLLYNCAQDNSLAPFTGYAEFPKRKTAMLIETPVMATRQENMADEIGMVPLPKWKAGASYYYPVAADGYAVPVCAKNVPGAVAYLYELIKAVSIRNSTEPGLTEYRKRIPKNWEDMRAEYIKNAKPCYCYVDGLSNWYSSKGNRQKFLDIIMTEKVNPATALDRMLPLLQSSLRATVG